MAHVPRRPLFYLAVLSTGFALGGFLSALLERVLPAGAPAPVGPDGRRAEPLLKPLITGGRLVRDLPPPRTLREYVMEQMARIDITAGRDHGLRGDY